MLLVVCWCCRCVLAFALWRGVLFVDLCALCVVGGSCLSFID